MASMVCFCFVINMGLSSSKKFMLYVVRICHWKFSVCISKEGENQLMTAVWATWQGARQGYMNMPLSERPPGSSKVFVGQIGK
jgi:hypothetical protein